MKANQKFVHADEAVSPVIGVILMVAITVVLAAVVFVLVSNLGGDTESTPTMSFDKSEGNNRLTVISASEAVWSDIKASVVGASCTLALNGASVTLTSGVADPVGSGDVNAGDYLTLAGGTSCDLTLTYKPSNSLLGSWSFTI